MQYLYPITIATLATVTAVAAPASRAEPRTESELRTIVRLLPGRYDGPVGTATRVSGGGLKHKIARLDAPQFGEIVFYHQIARDSIDSTSPSAQKIYVFDRDPRRTHNSTRSFVIMPGRGLANLEQDLAAQRTLDPATLLRFPAECDLRWTRDRRQGAFVAHVGREHCSFDSPSFRQRIAPDMTYSVSPESFSIEETLYGENGQPLVPPLARQASQRVTPVTAGEILAASSPTEWRRPDPARTLYLELPQGRVVFELAPQFAPRHVENLRALVRERWFDGLAINRVQDNFVVQWGDPGPGATRPILHAERTLQPEFMRAWTPDLGVVPLPDRDGYAAQAGFVDGFAVAGDRKAGHIWLAHCYGALGVGRDTAADSGSGAELYVVIGHAPRQLDRNITLVGRALSGMERLSGLPRGDGAQGFYSSPRQQVPILAVRFASDVPELERTPLEVLRTDTPTFARLVEARRNRRDDWYAQPAGHIDLCSVPLPVRRPLN